MTAKYKHDVLVVPHAMEVSAFLPKHRMLQNQLVRGSMLPWLLAWLFGAQHVHTSVSQQHNRNAFAFGCRHLGRIGRCLISTLNLRWQPMSEMTAGPLPIDLLRFET